MEQAKSWLFVFAILGALYFLAPPIFRALDGMDQNTTTCIYTYSSSSYVCGEEVKKSW